MSALEGDSLISYLAANPTAGDVITGTGGACKVRWATRNKGKSGSVRVITLYSGADLPVFLITVFSKSQRVNITPAGRNAIRTLSMALIDAYGK